MNGAQLLLDAGLVFAAPSPSDGGELNSVTVSPGLPGFFAAFVLAVLVVRLAISMTRHTRRIQAQARLKERIEAEERAEAEQAAAEADGGPVDAQSVDGQPVETQPVETQPTTDQSASEQPAEDPSTTDQPTSEANGPAGDRPEGGTRPSTEDR